MVIAYRAVNCVKNVAVDRLAAGKDVMDDFIFLLVARIDKPSAAPDGAVGVISVAAAPAQPVGGVGVAYAALDRGQLAEQVIVAHRQ